MTGRILVVENEPSVKKPLLRALRGHDVAFAEDGAAALKAAGHSPQPDLILMDIRLPHSSGFEVSGMLRARSETRDIPVLFMTTTPGEAEDSDYIVSRSDVSALKRRIETLLDELEGTKVFREIYSTTMLQSPSSPARELTEQESKELVQGGFPVNATVKPRPIAERAAQYAALIRSSLSTAEAAERLGVNPSRIRQRLLDRPPTLYGLRRANEWILPAFQFRENGLVPDIDRIIPRLDPALDLVAVYRWFSSPNPDLVHDENNVSPLDWLRQGFSWEAVADLAEDL